MATTHPQPSTTIEPGTWAIDPSHTSVEFVARHLMVTKVRGVFGPVEGEVTIADDPLRSSVVARVDAASVTSGDEKRDEHLRSADFFDVEQYPAIVFASKRVEERGDSYVLVGDLTLHGVSREVAWDLEFDGSTKDPWGGTRAGFSATTEVNRKDWGLTWNVALEAGGVVVSDKVRLNVDVELIKQ
jgi:polyisoprenoid-binding protein YceI